MVLTRAQNQPGPDGVLGTGRRRPGRRQHRLARGSTRARPTPRTPRTRCSCASTTLRRPAARSRPAGCSAACDADRGRPTPGSPDGRPTGISTWASTKKQAAEKLGLLLADADVTNIPMLATDPYGKFIPGPARGLPQYVQDGRRLVEGDLGPATRCRCRPTCGTSTRRSSPTSRTTPTRAAGHATTTRRPRHGRAGPGRRHHAVRRLREPGRRAPTTTRCSTPTSPAVTAGATRTSR